MDSIKIGRIVLLTGGTIALYLLLRRITHSRPASALADSPPQPSSRARGVRLCQVYPSPGSEATTDVDVIAIHGLDTDSPRTWTWKHKGQKQDVNWLEDPDMLPQRIPRARIFTCNWPADLFEESDLVQKTIDEFARVLLASIKKRPPVTKDDSGRDTRPIVFIASCLGGVILMKALVMADHEFLTVGEATRGIVFLATPFRGTSFQDVANWAEPGLRAWAFIQNKMVSNLLRDVKSNFDLAELVRRFTSFCRANELSDSVFTFYETRSTSLPRKILPWLPSKGTPLVDKLSATLDIVPHPIPLDRPHIQMNKFDSPNDPEYDLIADRIETLLRAIREGRPIEKANKFVRQNRYSKETLKIERLSGDQLPMDQCYINLIIVERSITGLGEHESSFSLQSRLSVESPQKGMEIALPTLFQTRHTTNGRITPRRILIHGRAGVGKTTLCKKIVYEFIHRNLWSDLFDWVLWVPLRNLKLEERRRSAEYNFRDLFRHEYFSQHPEGNELADALWRALIETKGARILFLLDGLDEVSRDLEGNMLYFLKELLNQSNVIITARPNATIPTNIEPLHLQLDTIGFHSNQVNTYIKSVFTDMQTGKLDLGKMEEIQSFLSCHPLIQGLVRIPIQLDVLCYTWNDYRGMKPNGADAQETMTAIYQRIEQTLWRKDAENLEKWTRSQIQDAYDEDIRTSTDDEQRIIELLAFYGMYNDVIDFEPRHRGIISKHFKHHDRKFLLDSMLGRVSFLRSSNLSSKANKRNYHFLHLTFQEYFGARYFVRQWKSQQPLKCLGLEDEENTSTGPTEFLRRNKYNARYDIFWRFVAGLLSSGRESRAFFQTIEAEPRDLLGGAHQRLVAHCLSETLRSIPHRIRLEDQLVRWLLFECSFRQKSVLAEELELGVNVMKKALQQAPEGAHILINSYKERMSEERARFMALLIEDERYYMRNSALLALQGQTVVQQHLQSIVGCLGDQNFNVKESAFRALEGQKLRNEHLDIVIASLEDEYYGIRQGALRVLQRQTLPKKYLQAVTVYLQSEDYDARSLAAQILHSQPASDELFQCIEPYLYSENPDIRASALYALEDQPISNEYLQAVIVCLEDVDSFLRRAAVRMLQTQPATKEYFQSIAPYLHHENPDARVAALEALEGRPIPKELLQAVMVCLEDDSPDVRDGAVRTLRSQPAKKEHLQRIAPYLSSRIWEARAGALQMLGRQPAILETHLQAIVTGLNDEIAAVKEAALNALKNQPILPEELLKSISLSLEDGNESVRREALEVLRNRPPLPPEVLRAVALSLKEGDTYIRLGALDVLKTQPALPEELLQTIAEYLNADNWKHKDAALVAFKNQPSLSEEVLQGIAICLHDGDLQIKKTAREALESQTILPRQLLQSIAAHLHVGRDNWEMAIFLAKREDLSLIPIECVGLFYKTLLLSTFGAYTITWQDVDNVSHITIGHEDYSSVWPDGFKDAIRETQREIGFPPQHSCIDSKS
ncbi:ARM repeat-containing protein [Xylaria sp. FL1777]|nr:ARM repeat-containing protein [Xylaria sp. FL1777]